MAAAGRATEDHLLLGPRASAGESLFLRQCPGIAVGQNAMPAGGDARNVEEGAGGWLLIPKARSLCAATIFSRPCHWLMRFVRHMSRAEVERIAAAMRGLLAPVFECYEPLLQRSGGMGLIRRSGCLYVYPLAKRQASGNSERICAAAWASTCATSAPTSLPNSNLT